MLKNCLWCWRREPESRWSQVHMIIFSPLRYLIFFSFFFFSPPLGSRADHSQSYIHPLPIGNWEPGQNLTSGGPKDRPLLVRYTSIPHRRLRVEEKREIFFSLNFGEAFSLRFSGQPHGNYRQRPVLSNRLVPGPWFTSGSALPKKYLKGKSVRLKNR